MRRVQETITDPIALDSESDPIGIDDEAELPPLATVSLTRREYVHSPGYVDEVVAQVDVSAAAGASHGADRPAWVIQDANYNLVALIDDAGAMLHQYTWDPYGEPVAIERFDTGGAGSPAPFENRIGHQGLFFARFDGQANNVLLPQLWVDAGTGLAAQGLYQNRNRSYNPRLGRFVQRDPNELGAFLRKAGKPMGARPRVSVKAPDLIRTYGDGSSAFAYLGSLPVSRTDPEGLFFGGLAGLLMAGLDGAQGAADSLESAREGLSTFASLHAMLQQYAGQQDLDADWASDWSQSDDGLLPGIHEVEMGEDATGLVMAGRKGKATGGGKNRLPPKSLRNKKRPVTVDGKRMVVTFDRNGYPIFPRGAIKNDISYRQTGDRKADAKGANAKCGYDKEPLGYIRHHHQNKNRMQLVHEDAHAVFHYGGVARHR